MEKMCAKKIKGAKYSLVIQNKISKKVCFPKCTITRLIIVLGLPDTTGVLKRLDDIGQTLMRLAGELKQCVEEVRVVNARQLERLEQERASALLAASVDDQVDSEQVSLSNVEDTEAKKCANCNREASAECSLCRRTPYCSTYCQKKDWAAHQIECLRSVPTIHSESQQHQSIMLIVESQHQ